MTTHNLRPRAGSRSEGALVIVGTSLHGGGRAASSTLSVAERLLRTTPQGASQSPARLERTPRHFFAKKSRRSGKTQKRTGR